MSLLNLALQGAGVARRVTTYEDQLKACSNTKQIYLCAEQVPGLNDAIADSLEAPNTLLYSLFRKLKLKDKVVREFHASSDHDIDTFWDVIEDVFQSHQILSQRKIITKIFPQPMELKHLSSTNLQAGAILEAIFTKCSVCQECGNSNPVLNSASIGD